MQLDRFDAKYWQLIMFQDTTIAAICRDGQLYMFDAADVEGKLAGLPKDKHGWFFNETRDRYCAEWQDSSRKRICINPSMVVQLFGLPVLT